MALRRERAATTRNESAPPWRSAFLELRDAHQKLASKEAEAAVASKRLALSSPAEGKELQDYLQVQEELRHAFVNFEAAYTRYMNLLERGFAAR
jgi:hypothetical protein